VTAQRELAHHTWPDAAVVRVRMGLHTGEPTRVAEGYVGLDVHYAARIMSAGHGGQVLLSQTTRDLVEQDLLAGVSLRDLGEHRLKDLEQPIALSSGGYRGSASRFSTTQNPRSPLSQPPCAADPAHWTGARSSD